MHRRYFRSCLLIGISLVLLIGAECKPVQVRSVDSQQPGRCRQDRPRSGRHSCTDATKLKRYFFHPTKPKGCKRFAICPSAVAQYESSVNDTEENYFPDFISCQMECMTHIQCPELLGSHVQYSPDGSQAWGRRVTYECNNGYSLSQPQLNRKRERICQKNGTWSGRPPVCLQQCQDPPAISHANIAPAKDLHNQGSTVHYACDVGYRLEGSAQRTCEEGGEWAEPEPSCVCAVTQTNGECLNCHASPIENGVTTAPNVSINAVVRYTCKEHYILIGNSSRYCLEEGVWSGHEPMCWKVNIVMGVRGSDETEDVTNKTAIVKAGSKDIFFRAIPTNPNPFNFEWLWNGKTQLPHAVITGRVHELLTFDFILKSKEQYGNYTIRLGDFSASFTLNISEPEVITSTNLPNIIDHPTNTTASVGAHVSFLCVVSGESTLPYLTWYHNNVTITDGERHIIDLATSTTLAIGILYIRRVEIEDQGQYHCTAENIAGIVFSTVAQLSITTSLTRRFAEEDTGMSSLCSQKSADAVTILGRVRKTTSNLNLIKRYKVHIKQVLRSSSKMEELGRSKSIRTILLEDVLDDKEGKLKANRDYVFQGRLLGSKVLLVSGDNVYQYTPSLQRHLASC